MDQAHVDLPVPALVGGPAPDRRDQRFEVGSRHMLRMRQVTVVRGPSQPVGPQQVVEPVPPALRAIARWRFARASRLPRPQGAHFFQVRDLRPEVGDLLGELLLARRLGLRTGSRAPRPALGLRAQGPGPAGTVFAAPALQGRDARDCVFGHDLRLGHVVVDVVAGDRDLRFFPSRSCVCPSRP